MENLSSLKLRELATSIDEVNSMENWLKNLNFTSGEIFGVRVNWQYGSACDGYKELSKFVSLLVETKLLELITKAIKNQKNEVERLKQVCKDYEVLD